MIDPLGGINSLWPLFGIANQLLAAIALALATTLFVKSARPAFAFATATPLAWLLTVTMTAGWQKILDPDRRIGFLAQADHFASQLAQGLVPPEKLREMQTVDLQRPPRRRDHGPVHGAGRDRRARRGARVVADAARSGPRPATVASEAVEA